MRAALGLILCSSLLACGSNGNDNVDMTPAPDLSVTVDMTMPADMTKPAHMCTGQTDFSAKCTACIQGVLGQGATGSGPCKTQMMMCLADTSGSDYPAPDGGMLSCKGVVDCLMAMVSQGTCVGMASSGAQNLLFAAFGCGNGACQNM